MTGRRLITVRNGLLVALVVCALGGTCLAHTVDVALTDLKPVLAAGVRVNVAVEPLTDAGRRVLRVRYSKTTEERRMVALAAPVDVDLTGLKAGELRYRLEVRRGAAPRLGFVLFDADGGSWYKVAGDTLQVGDFRTARLPLANLQLAAYAQDESGQLELNKVRRAWVALLLDGAGKGIVEISAARLTSEAYKPTEPFRVTGPDAGTWGVSQDPAVAGKVTVVPDGYEGRPCIKYDFTVPAGRHMYAIPNTSIAAGEYEGYSALRFRYKASVPKGMRMLVTLPERTGGAYYNEPAGPWAGEWTTMTVPFEALKLASWGQKDANGKFDPGDISGVQIGCHGTPEAAGPGWLWVADVELVP
jgi:hypothetical protein